MSLLVPIQSYNKHMQNCKLIQRNMVYVMGLPFSLKIFEDSFNESAFFGNYGRVLSISIAEDTNNGHKTLSAFVTYDCELSATLAVVALDKMKIDNCLIRAGYGSNKYCMYFLNGLPCLKKICTYAHKMASPKLCFYN